MTPYFTLFKAPVSIQQTSEIYTDQAQKKVPNCKNNREMAQTTYELVDSLTRNFKEFG